MTEIINLRQKRKTVERANKEKKAEENCRLYGRTKAQKQLDKLEAEKKSKHLDAHKLEKDT